MNDYQIKWLMKLIFWTRGNLPVFPFPLAVRREDQPSAWEETATLQSHSFRFQHIALFVGWKKQNISTRTWDLKGTHAYKKLDLNSST
jgi:hypothetical protein